jgi:hypothetical protein
MCPPLAYNVSPMPASRIAEIIHPTSLLKEIRNFNCFMKTIIKLNHVTIQYIVSIFTLKMLSAHPENPHSTVCFFFIPQKKVLIWVFLEKNSNLAFTLQVHACTVLLLLTMEVWHLGMSSNGILSY